MIADKKALWIQAAQNVQEQVHALIEAEFARLSNAHLTTDQRIHTAAASALSYFQARVRPPVGTSTFSDTVECINMIRAKHGLGLKEAKDVTDSVRKQIWGA